MSASPSQQDHRAFLNRYYGAARHVYDASRKYYLLGRDRAIRELLEEDWDSLVEVGPGTGRNLQMLHRGRPSAALGGIEASDAMLEHAESRCRFAKLVHGFAEEADYGAVLGRAPDRILFSYCLSMVQDPVKALAHARASLSPGGQVMVVDFADLGGLPRPAQAVLSRWLRMFHVEPLDESLLRGEDARITYGPGHYYLLGRIDAA